MLPRPESQTAILLPLRYYEIDPGFNVPAALRLSDDRPVFEMPTSTGTLRRMERVGVLEFRVERSVVDPGGVRARGNPANRLTLRALC